MILVGILLMLAAGAAAAFAALAGTDSVSATWNGMTVNTTVLGAFASGALAMLVFWLGLRSIRHGAGRQSARRRELRELRATSTHDTAEHDREPASADR